MTLSDIAAAIRQTQERIRVAERRYGRVPDSVQLLAVSKGQSAEAIRAAQAAGLHQFGESYVQEAVAKMDALSDLPLQWHFIGPIQANKTRTIAERFDWVHSLDRLKIAERLDGQRPESLPPLQVCIQVNISAEASKSGIAPDALIEFAAALARLPHLKLRGLMGIPAVSDDEQAQRAAFRRLRECQERLQRAGHVLDTLSMGMSGDFEAAIAEGSTLVRIGTALFGERRSKPGD
jgi:pyridoxal phosphate enzyme (YggS family)